MLRQYIKDVIHLTDSVEELFSHFVVVLTALRKQARHIENDIDVKLVAFSKVGAGSGTTTADTAPLLSENLFDSLSVEIVQMLDKVKTVYWNFDSILSNSSTSIDRFSCPR